MSEEQLSIYEAMAEIELGAPTAWDEWSRSNDPRDKGFAEGLDQAVAILARVRECADQFAVINLIEEGYSIKRGADGMWWGIPPDRDVWIPLTPNLEWKQVARRKKV